MALTLNQTPGTYYSAHGDVIYTIYEATKANDSVTYPDYKYICDVYINSTLVASLTSYPNPTNKRGVLNISKVISSYLATAFNPASSGIRSQEFGSGEFFIDVVCKFGEDYDGTTYTNLLTDSSRRFYNHYNNRLIGTLTNLSAFVDKVVSNRPQVNYVALTNENSYIGYMPSTTGAIAIQVKTYDGTNSLVATNNTTVTPTAASNLQQLNVSPGIINGVFSSMITDATKYYTVKINNDTYTFYPVCVPKFTKYVLHFINQYGAFESYAFRYVSKKSINITKGGFQKLPYTMDASGTISYKSSNGVYNEQQSTFAATWKEKLMLTTDNLTDAEYTWLAELVISPQVYIESGGYFIPVSITQTNYDYRTFAANKLTPLELTVEYGDTLNAQFR